MTYGKLQESVQIDIPLVKRLVATQFPEWADLPIKPVELGGWDNRTFHLGDEMSVRLPSAKRYAAQVERERRWLPGIAPQLPLPIPVPLAMGAPGEGYPWHWSIYRWLEGEIATIERIEDLNRFASDLGIFLKTLQRIDPTDAPTPGMDNFFRGGVLSAYDREARDAIDALRGYVDTRAATA
ncbi:MAG: phosphotransferase, partial [Gammaproteobacteria bacterium]|nr:phosphotransferase [Gammaproteobacteria bacterium]